MCFVIVISSFGILGFVKNDKNNKINGEEVTLSDYKTSGEYGEYIELNSNLQNTSKNINVNVENLDTGGVEIEEQDGKTAKLWKGEVETVT